MNPNSVDILTKIIFTPNEFSPQLPDNLVGNAWSVVGRRIHLKPHRSLAGHNFYAFRVRLREKIAVRSICNPDSGVGKASNANGRRTATVCVGPHKMTSLIGPLRRSTGRPAT